MRSPWNVDSLRTAVRRPCLPDEIVARLSAAVSEVYRSGAVDRYLESSEKMSGTPAEFERVLASDVVKYRRFIDAAGFLRDQK